MANNSHFLGRSPAPCQAQAIGQLRGVGTISIYLNVGIWRVKIALAPGLGDKEDLTPGQFHLELDAVCPAPPLHPWARQNLEMQAGEGRSKARKGFPGRITISVKF